MDLEEQDSGHTKDFHIRSRFTSKVTERRRRNRDLEGKKDFKCNYCDRSYAFKANLYRHKKLHHTNIDIPDLKGTEPDRDSPLSLTKKKLTKIPVDDLVEQDTDFSEVKAQTIVPKEQLTENVGGNEAVDVTEAIVPQSIKPVAYIAPNPKVSKRPSKPQKSYYRCKFCPFTSYSWLKKERHQKECAGRERTLFKCSFCSESFPSAEVRNSHEIKSHRNSPAADVKPPVTGMNSNKGTNSASSKKMYIHLSSPEGSSDDDFVVVRSKSKSKSTPQPRRISKVFSFLSSDDENEIYHPRKKQCQTTPNSKYASNRVDPSVTTPKPDRESKSQTSETNNGEQSKDLKCTWCPQVFQSPLWKKLHEISHTMKKGQEKVNEGSDGQILETLKKRSFSSRSPALKSRKLGGLKVKTSKADSSPSLTVTPRRKNSKSPRRIEASVDETEPAQNKDQQSFATFLRKHILTPKNKSSVVNKTSFIPGATTLDRYSGEICQSPSLDKGNKLTATSESSLNSRSSNASAETESPEKVQQNVNTPRKLSKVTKKPKKLLSDKSKSVFKEIEINDSRSQVGSETHQLSLEPRVDKITNDENADELQWKCGFCPKSFSEKSLLMDHENQVHYFKCTFCPKVFRISSSRKKHEKIVHKEILASTSFNLSALLAEDIRQIQLDLEAKKGNCDQLKINNDVGMKADSPRESQRHPEDYSEEHIQLYKDPIQLEPQSPPKKSRNSRVKIKFNFQLPVKSPPGSQSHNLTSATVRGNSDTSCAKLHPVETFKQQDSDSRANSATKEKGKSQNMMCVECLRIFSSVDDLRTHFLIDHMRIDPAMLTKEDVKPKVKNIVESNSGSCCQTKSYEKTNNCRECQGPFTSDLDLAWHYGQDHNLPRVILRKLRIIEDTH